MKIDDAQFSKIIEAIDGISKIRAYDLDILDAALFSSFVSVLAVICTVFIFHRQKNLMQQQNKTIQAQADISQKQVQIMSQQSNIALLEYRLKVFSTINKVLVYIIEDKFKENFILCALDKNAFSKKMNAYTCLRDSFTEQAYNSSIVFDEDISKVLVDASKKFNTLIEMSFEVIFMMQVNSLCTSEKNQEEQRNALKDFVVAGKIDFQELPEHIKGTMKIEQAKELSEEIYNILSDAKLHKMIDNYIDSHKKG